MSYKITRIDKDGTAWIEVVALIHNNETGEIRQHMAEIFTYEDWNGNLQGNPFAWEENNYRCDCNRELFFYRAADEDESDVEDTGYCKGEGKYSANLINPVNGDIIYQEYE